MGIIARQSFWNSTILYLGVILGAINRLYFFPNEEHVMTTEQLGLLGVLTSAALIGTQLSLLSAPNAIIRFFPFFRDIEKGHHGLITFITRTTLITTVVTLASYFLLKEIIIGTYASKSAMFEEFYGYVALLIVFMVFQDIFAAYVRSLLKSVYQTFVKELALRVYQTILLLLLFFDVIGFETFLILYVLSWGMTMLMLMAYLIVLKDFKMIAPVQLERSQKKKITRFSASTFHIGLSGTIINNVDILMVGALAPMLNGQNGIEQAGIYTITAFVGRLILMPSKSIQGVSVPLISRAWKDNDMDELNTLYRKSALNQLILGLLTFAGIWANIDNIFALLPEKYSQADGETVVLFTSLANLFNISMGLNSQIITNSRYYWFNAISIPFLALVAIVTNYILIPDHGIVGAAIATSISLFIFNIIMFSFLLVKYKMQPFSWRNLFVIGLGLAAIFTAMALPDAQNIWVNIVIKSGVVLAIFVPGILLSKVSPDINQLILKVLRLGRKNR